MKQFVIFFCFIFFSHSSIGQTKTIINEAKLKETEHVFSKVLRIVPKGSNISIVSEIGNGIYKVKYENLIGYMNDLYWKTVETSQISNKNSYSINRNNFSSGSQKLRTSDNTSQIIYMTKTDSGLFEVPVTINGVLKIYFIMDSGASEVSISPDVALTLVRTKTIGDDDWLEGKYYKFADGSIAKSERFKLDKIEIGSYTLYNINAAISNSIDAPMLLGQNVLSRLGRIVIDYNKNTLEIIK